MSEPSYKKLSKKKLNKLETHGDPERAKLAKDELDRRKESRKFFISFLFPNLWAILSLALAAYNVLFKESH